MNPEKVLPPGVNGKITGYLTVKVDEIFWARNSPGEVVVQLQWWGEKDCTFFRPGDITHNELNKNSDNSVIYNIRTSPGLFESYLRNCGRVTFTVLRGQNKNVILGSAVIKEVERILSDKHYHSYFSIFSPKGNRIGDLHVSFELTFKQTGTNSTKQKPIEKCFKVKPENNCNTAYSDQLLSNKCKSASPRGDKLFSHILQKGYELRKAMVMSVLADCPVDKLDSVVNCDPELNFMKQCSQEEEAKLVDFLLGKHMSAEEEVKALKTLRCISPAENFIDIAKEAKTIKSKCCLHGQDCCEENTAGFERKEEKSEPFSLKTNSAASIDLAQIRESDRLIDDDTLIKRKEETKFNCYRITISSLKLSLDGSRKIFYVPGHNHNPPGTYFILEIKFPSKGEYSSRSIKFLTKKLKGHRVDFDQGSTHRLCGSINWSRVCSLLNGSVFNISWRHLNQRLPCPLGSTKLEKLNPPNTGAYSMCLCLPIYSNTRLLTGHINVTISLGILDNLKEGIFHITKKTDENLEDVNEFDNNFCSSSANPNMHVEPLDIVSSSHSVSSAAAVTSDEAFPVTRLDEEILKTIDLLNSKSDDTVNRNPKVEKHEACVQTTLPFTETNCFCHCQKPLKNYGDAFKTEETSVKQLEDNNPFKTTNYDSGFEKGYKFEKHFCRVPYNLCEDYCRKDFDCNDSILDRKKGIVGAPLDHEKTKVHNFTVKIEKVVGIPLFTGDNDMDCYVDYSFPKVDCTGKMVFDKVTNGTGIQMALRETEFKTVNRHKIRLNSKLTKALMTLPVHEITFCVWGRYYRPRPRDYMLGKATLPLMKLSNLELVYYQQRKREAIFEKIIIPITVVESSVTYGYKGSFGDLHVILGYSCAAATSYKEWRDFSDHVICDKNEGLCKHSYPDRNIPRMDLYQDKEKDNKVDETLNKLNPDFTHSSRINSRNKILNSPDFIQSNVNLLNRCCYHDIKTQSIEKLQNQQDGAAIDSGNNIPLRGNNNAVDGITHAKDLNLESIKMNGLPEFNGPDTEVPSGIGTKLGNLFKEVLCDMRERNTDNSVKCKSTTHGILSDQEKIPKVTDSRACGDAFELFDLKVDLPSTGESMDFEARSQCSFLCSPPHMPHYISNHPHNLRLESDSSFSMKDVTQNPVNPFSSLSNMSFSVNSDSSMFNVHGEGNLPCQTNSNINLNKEEPSINENIIGDHNSLLPEKNQEAPSINENNNNRIFDSNGIMRNLSISSESEKDDIQSTDATLKSLESLKSFKEDFGGRESKDIGVETEFITQNKDTQTSYTSYKEENFFKVRVQICRALGLPSVEVRQPNGKTAMVKPTSYAYFSAMMDGKPRILKTKIVEKKCNPIWNQSWDVELPVDFLKKCDRELEVFVDLNGGTEEPARGSDCSSQWPIVLRTGVDLTPITAGLEHASGWFSLSDRSLFSRAQLKVVVTPLEDVSPFRDEWLKEYTKTKGKKIEINVPDSSSIATSLQEKLKELEKLTERMKNKMNDRPNWNNSPPIDLLTEVQAVSLPQDQTNVKSCESSWSGIVQRVEIATSPLVVDLTENNGSPLVTNQKSCSPETCLENEEEKSGVCTYTLDVESGSSNNDSLETPSETIDRILLKLRSKR